MALVTTKKMLLDARKKGYAVGHFNVENLETVQAVVDAAVECNSPVILAATESAIAYAGIEYLAALVKVAAKANVPVALHLDHGKRIDAVRACLKAGFTSIMIDASLKPYKENIRITKQVVKLCKNIPVEAELGSIESKDNFTDVDEAVDFVKKTGIHSLAVAIGTSHGAYKFKDKPVLDFERLRQIHEKVSVPLVLHGASRIPPDVVKKGHKYGAAWHGAMGVDDASLRKARKLGICKVNVHTDLNLVRIASIREYLSKNPTETDPRHVLGYAREQTKKFVISKLKVLGSAGQAGKR